MGSGVEGGRDKKLKVMEKRKPLDSTAQKYGYDSYGVYMSQWNFDD